MTAKSSPPSLPLPLSFSCAATDPASEPYVSKTANLRRRLQRLLSVPEERTKRLNLRDKVREIEYTPTGSDFESGFVLYQILRAAFPKTYSNRLRLRFAPLVKLHLENEYPRASITTRLGRLGGKNLYYGPFHSRIAAEKFMNDALDFFKMRRCVEDLHPDPKFPRLRLFRNEDVPGPMLSRLHGRRISRRGHPGRRLSRYSR